MRRTAILLGLLVLVGFSFGDTIQIPADYLTIQEGIDVAIDGDTVLVADGTYIGDGNRDIDFGGLAIVVKSQNGSNLTVIDCDADSLDQHRGFYFHSGEDSFAKLEGFTITNGYMSVGGGGIWCYSSSSPTIKDCTISGNTTTNTGGGIYCSSSSPTITDCTIEGNMGSGTYTYGGGIACRYDSSPTITNCTITGNAGYWGGGIYSDPTIIGFSSSPTITNCTITGNTASSFGAGIYCNDSSPIITNCAIEGNTASSFGGGIYCSSSSPTITNCTIEGNTASSYGTGIYCYNSSSPTITNCAIEGNKASGISGNGVVIYCYDSSPTITNCILWNDSPEEIYVFSGDPVVTYSDIQGGWSGMGNIDANPLFRNSENGDYRLQSVACGGPEDSPCIDTGDPSISDFILDCEHGLGNDRSDMGAYGGNDEGPPVGVDKPNDSETLPSSNRICSLAQNFPNPFNPMTTISYTLAEENHVSLKVFNMSGRLVATLVNGVQGLGLHSVVWYGTSNKGQPVSSGIYIYRLTAGETKESNKMLLLK